MSLIDVLQSQDDFKQIILWLSLLGAPGRVIIITLGLTRWCQDK